MEEDSRPQATRSAPGDSPRVRGLREALEAVDSPDSRGRFSALCGEGVLVVGPTRERGLGLDERARLRRALAALPCPSVLLGGVAAEAPEVGAAFDVRAASAEELAELVEVIRAFPLACLALVELLRRSERRSVHEALLDESLVYSTLQAGPEFAAWLVARPPRSPPAGFEGRPLYVERCGAQLRLRLDRPERRNAFSAAMRDALCEALELAVADSEILEIELSGAGPAFCSGGDLDEFGTLPDPATAHAIRSTRHVARLLFACAGRARARIHGACVGAGIELPAFCGRVVAARDVSIRLPEVGMGLVPGAGGTCSLPRRIGRQRCAWLALCGRAVDAETALRWGLVDALET